MLSIRFRWFRTQSGHPREMKCLRYECSTEQCNLIFSWALYAKSKFCYPSCQKCLLYQSSLKTLFCFCFERIYSLQTKKLVGCLLSHAIDISLWLFTSCLSGPTGWQWQAYRLTVTQYILLVKIKGINMPVCTISNFFFKLFLCYWSLI